MKRLKLLLSFMKGNRLLYIGSIISIGLATLFSILSPLVLRLTVDSIIGDEPFDVPNWVSTLLSYIGNRDDLAQKLWVFGLAIVVFTLFRGLFLYYKGKWSAIASESIAKNIRERLYDHIQHLPYDYHVKVDTGDLLQRCTSDLETIRRFLAVQFVEIGRALFMLGFVTTVMVSLDIRMTLVAMAVIPIIFAFAVIFFMKVKRAFQLSDEAEASMSTVLQENLSGVRVVKAFGRQKYEIEKFDKKNREYRDLTYRLIRLLAAYWSSSDFICLLQIAAVLVVGVYWASIGRITLGTLLVFITYEGMLLWPVRQMGRILTDMGKALVSLERIQQILDEPIEKHEKHENKPEIKGNLEFKNVYFGYDKDSPVLKNITFKVEKGQTVAILGKTGSGKSSLVHLLARLYDYQRGSIKIDGVELKNIDKKWIRQNVGLVLQEPFLYSKTLRENIAISKPIDKESEVIEAAKAAAIHDSILEFEKGYNTPVGERGVTLSGGQKQRIAIARTIINNYPILIFDDSLSAVDTETDSKIRRTLKERNKDATTFIISHRVSTLAEADLILVLDKGRLVQKGTHDELIEQDGLYRNIWTIQSSLEKDYKYKIS
ncbi:ABC transporter ATP-binding protein [Thermohalobacter berrensis]|uniref:ABC transporter n=1 Tax=Thermohalobacter berrensis TaxID=99594 RepID=A0A419T8V4_9FIRM|nr:ABC transporter ATP-binding protein [Thermohalobacter berrensis]RKD33915.1 ABC transporter [Thermohalobacter berrensis]